MFVTWLKVRRSPSVNKTTVMPHPPPSPLPAEAALCKILADTTHCGVRSFNLGTAANEGFAAAEVGKGACCSGTVA